MPPTSKLASALPIFGCLKSAVPRPCISCGWFIFIANPCNFISSGAPIIINCAASASAFNFPCSIVSLVRTISLIWKMTSFSRITSKDSIAKALVLISTGSAKSGSEVIFSDGVLSDFGRRITNRLALTVAEFSWFLPIL